MRKKILSLLFLIGLPSALCAEATKEYYRDAGIYNTDPFTIITFAFSTVNLDFNSTADPVPPEGLKVSSTTVNTQWGGWGIFETTQFNNFTITERDFSDYVGGAVRFWLKSTISLDFKIEYKQGGNNPQAVVTIGSTGGNWSEIIIPLGSGGFGLSTNNLSNIRAPFIVVAPQTTAVQKQWFLDHIRWTKPVTSLAIFPTTTTVTVGRHRQFTVEGRNGGDRVIIYSTFSASAAAGTMNPATPNFVTASTLTAANSAGNGTSTAYLVNLSTSANVSVVTPPITETFGLLSETVPGLLIDTDSKLFYDHGGSGGSLDPITLDEVNSDNREGSKRFKTTIKNQTAVDSFSGWILNWGLDASTDVVRDMNRYYDGSIRFWFKGPSALQNGMVVGMRSANCDFLNGEPTELSKANLKDYVAFDDQWHPVVIPLAKFAGARPWADLSRMKILFTMFATGSTGGSDRTFYIDNLRWDARTPGALHHMGVSPNPVTVPLNAKRLFTARGFDINNVPLDIWPTWTKSGGDVGVLANTQGVSNLLTTPASAVTGNLIVTEASISSTTIVTVANFSYTQSYNVYSDLGAGGSVGVFQVGATGTKLSLKEVTTGSIEGSKFFRSTFTLTTDILNPQAFAGWFVEETGGSRFLSDFDTGYLQFQVRTDQDLQFSVRSSNIVPGQETAKFLLSELGVPRDNNWQYVAVAIADLVARDPQLDLTKVQNYFTITALSSQLGTNTVPKQFDVDDVKWLSIKPLANGAKIYAGLKAKQHPVSGLVRSFDNTVSSRSVTYDQALTAMTYTYQKDFTLTAKIFDFYKTRYGDGTGFNGFHDEYKWDIAAPGQVLLSSQTAGPNAFLLLSMIHHRNASGSLSYDATMAGIASWLLSLQDPTLVGGKIDGGIRFGMNGNTLLLNKSTEHNFDCYAAFKAYGQLTQNAVYKTAADDVYRWIETKAWKGTRFYVGRDASGNPVVDRALDAYSWAPLALSSFTSVLTNPVDGAEVSFSTKAVNFTTGLLVDGFDFSSFPLSGDQPADRDAVWLEGTAQMALAYLAAGNTSKWGYYKGQLGFAIYTTGATTEGLTYATTPGTAYGAGFIMDATHAAASSMAWYLFAVNTFNPFKPFSVNSATIRNLSDGLVASSVTWTASIPRPYAARWLRADQYLELDVQPIVSPTLEPWGMRVYTDNTNPIFSPPRYADPSPLVTTNPDSNPAGLLQNIPGQNNPTSTKLDLAWRIMDSTFTLPTAVAPFSLCLPSEGPESSSWFYFVDRLTPAIDGNGDGLLGGPCDGAVFQVPSPTYDYATIMQNPRSIHTQQNAFTASTNPDYVFFEANFGGAAAQVNYITRILIEFFSL